MDAMNVENFTSGMPEFGGTLSDDQIIDILAYIHSTWPEQAQQAQASRTQGH
jgi:mono/diheme cytochrome c family protein